MTNGKSDTFWTDTVAECSAVFEKPGDRVLFRGDDKLQWFINDDLSGLENMTVTVEGKKVKRSWFHRLLRFFGF